MTDFEKTIKREMTREKFLAIRDHKYGVDNDTFLDYTYGNVSSWLTWNRDENCRIVKGNIPEDYPIELKEAIEKNSRLGHIWDGPIDNWDQDKSLPPDRQITRRITSDIVFIGLNMSADGKPIPGPCFQNARGHKRIVNTFFGTEAEGAYFTDIIKSDKRFLDKIGKPADSEEVMRIIKAKPDVLKDHIRLFKEELDFIGAVKPLLIVFGNYAEQVLKEGMDKDFLTERFHAVVKIGHYSLTNAIPGGDEGYQSDTRIKLMPYITLPKSERDQIIENICKKGYISTDDEITFWTVPEVLNKLFGKDYDGYRKAVCHVDQDHDVWFPKLDSIKNGKQYPGSVNWHNYFLNNNQDILVQYPTRDADLGTLVWPPVQFVKWTAYVFANVDGSYRFLGTYKSDRIATAGELGLKIDIEPNEPVEVFKRINKKAELPVFSKTN